ncbi:metal-sensitive transcriptional regulator [Thalassobacillus sp. CUG 92003]|uniref:metal-sensitive transcriptional regulator n=1 Tax=Thalassobacillus sp. CUG 92003 TaxID=2736641 RepID=UPI0015E6FCDC|nr:metal-sensitive transcriptional regulator [Thalassobacillus sp. CUG 92003]
MNYTNDMKNRVKRIEGQVRGILKMMEGNSECKELIMQLSASRSALDRTIGLIVGSNLADCVREFDDTQESEKYINEAVDLLIKSR